MFALLTQEVIQPFHLQLTPVERLRERELDDEGNAVRSPEYRAEAPELGSLLTAFVKMIKISLAVMRYRAQAKKVTKIKPDGEEKNVGAESL